MLEELIAQHRERIAACWFERVTATYPEQTTRFLRQQKDPFANPMGAALRRGMTLVVDALADGARLERAGDVRKGDQPAQNPQAQAQAQGPESMLDEGLDSIIRIRSIQDTGPSEAVVFVLELKHVLAQQLAEGSSTGAAQAQQARLESLIEHLLLRAFDIFVSLREEVYRIRVNEISNRSMKTLERLNEWRARRDEAVGLDAVE